MKTELDILLPVFNEAEYIEELLKGIDNAIKKKIKYKFLICEDGSTDGTKEILKSIIILWKKIRSLMVWGKDAFKMKFSI